VKHIEGGSQTRLHIQRRLFRNRFGNERRAYVSNSSCRKISGGAGREHRLCLYDPREAAGAGHPRSFLIGPAMVDASAVVNSVAIVSLVSPLFWFIYQRLLVRMPMRIQASTVSSMFPFDVLEG
jgi:hypothetical protein